MKKVFGINKLLRKYKSPVVAIGVFDGLHRGHQQLIKKAVLRARQIKGTAIVLTFYPHPVQVLRPEVQLSTLASLSYRLKLIESLGADVCVVINFTKKFSLVDPEAFIKNSIVKKIEPKEIFIGYDFKFGKNRSGNLALFKEKGEKHGFKVNVVGAVKNKQRPISSTLIRNLITEGKLKDARQLLGRQVSIMGEVSRGDLRGRTLGFPTANINPNCEVIPPCGVYAVLIDCGGKKLKGMANIGRRPSFKKANSKLNIEVHIFDFHKNIYGKEIIIEFIKKIRDEKVFLSKESLIRQLMVDEKKTRNILKR